MFKNFRQMYKNYIDKEGAKRVAASTAVENHVKGPEFLGQGALVEKAIKMKNSEYILCAAIHYDDGLTYVHQPVNIKTGFVVAGRRHHNCFATIKIVSGDNGDLKSKNASQGFITNQDRYLDRKEAFIVAEAAGQLLLKNKEPKTLISEDLWSTTHD